MNRELLMAELVRDESKRLKVYDDATGKAIGPGTLVKGHPTIGTGRALDVNGISDSENILLLSHDIDAVSAQVTAAFPWYVELSDARQRVLMNMAFNMGIDHLQGFPSTLALIQQAKYSDAAASMLASKWAKQTGARAVRLSEAMEKG